MSAPHISVVIPTYNKACHLALTLASLARQTELAFEVVVVDDGSTDDTALVLAKYAERLRLVVHRQTNRGRAAARNAGIRQSTGELLIFIDDDRVCDPRFIAAHAAATAAHEDRLTLGWQAGLLARWSPALELRWSELEAILARRPELLDVLGHGAVELVSETMFDEEPSRTLSDFGCTDPYWEYACAPLFAAFEPDLDRHAYPWLFAATGNMSISRRRVVDAGLFDEGFRGWGFEDSEFEYRLHARGAKFFLCRDAVNHHQLHARPQRMLREMKANALYWLAKDDSLEVAVLLANVYRYVSGPDAAGTLPTPEEGHELLLATREGTAAHRRLAAQYAKLLRKEIVPLYADSACAPEDPTWESSLVRSSALLAAPYFVK